MKNKRFGLGMLVMVLVFGVVIIGCNNEGRNPQLPGQWALASSNLPLDLISEKIEFLNDGTALLESSNIRGIGPFAQTVNWRIDDNGRLILTVQDTTQIYTIVELSRTTLIYEGSVPGFGNVRAKYLRLGGNSGLDGIWTLEEDADVKLVFSGDNWGLPIDGVSGTFTRNQNQVTLLLTHEDVEALSAEEQEEILFSYSLTGNTLVINTTDFAGTWIRQ